MSNIDYVIVVSFIVYALWTGLRSREKASENLEEYFLAGRSLKGWQAGLSMAATQFASDTPLLVCGMVAVGGIFSLWQIWIFALSFLLLGFVLAPCWRRARVLTDAEFTALRYQTRPTEFLRFFKAIYFGTVINCTALAWVFFAAAKISEPFLLWNEWLPENIYSGLFHLVKSVGVPLTLDPSLANALVWTNSTNNFISVAAIVAVTFLYSATGGLRAVVATDIVQLAIMTVATVSFAGALVYNVGGFSALTQKLRSLYDQPGAALTSEQLMAFTPLNIKDWSWSFFLVIALQWLIQVNSDGTGYLAQRAMACRTDRDAKVAGLIHGCYTIAGRALMWIPIALCLLVLYPMDTSAIGDVAAREGKYVLAMAEYLPIGIKGIMVTAMLAALASTVDTHLNWGSSYWTNDIYKHFICQKLLRVKPSPKSLVWVARISNVLILLIAAAIGTQLKSINDTWQIFLLLGSGVGIVLVLRWFWWRVSAWTEAAAIAASLVFAPVIYFTIDDPAVRLLVMAAISTAFAVAVSFTVGPESAATLKKFYDQVKPPGFWGPYSANRARDAKRLRDGLVAVMLGALTIFCILVGVGTWVLSQRIWSPALIVIGLGLVPIWWRLEFSGK